MRPFLLGLIIGIILLPLFAFCYVYFGYAPVATAEPPFPMERKITSIALKARISKEAPKDAAIPVNEENLMEGAKVYRQQCEICHGTGGPITPTAQGMFPRPPQLLHGKGVTDDPAGETYWKVKNGIRLTGMPAYGPSLSDQQIWQVSLFLANADKLPGTVSAYLAKPTEPSR
jgi:thiosulfate dehydrogenase